MNSVQRMSAMTMPMLLGAVVGCQRAPTFNIMGSFFPAWLICMVAGTILASVVNGLFVRLGLNTEIIWPVIVYPCLAVLFACALWLVSFS